MNVEMTAAHTHITNTHMHATGSLLTHVCGYAPSVISLSSARGMNEKKKKNLQKAMCVTSENNIIFKCNQNIRCVRRVHRGDRIGRKMHNRRPGRLVYGERVSGTWTRDKNALHATEPIVVSVVTSTLYALHNVNMIKCGLFSIN